MVEYTKIETIFERDMEGSKKLIEGKYRNPTIQYLKDNEWLWTEKVDGTNISVIYNGHTISFAGRTERAQIPAPLVNKLNELFGGPINEEIFEQKFGDMSVILFGEGYGKGIQGKTGAAYRDDVSFILFDVYLPNSNLWLTRESVEDIARAFNIDVVPIVSVGPLDEAVKYVKEKHKSEIAQHDLVMEGLVCRPMEGILDRRGRRVIVKIKVKDFE